MKGFSTEYAASLAMVLGFVFQIFNIQIGTEELTNVVSAIFVLGGFAYNLYKRYQRGGVTPLGFRK